MQLMGWWRISHLTRWYHRQSNRRQFFIAWILLNAWVDAIQIGYSVGFALSGQGFRTPPLWHFPAAGLFFAVAIPIVRQYNRDQRTEASDPDHQD